MRLLDCEVEQFTDDYGITVSIIGGGLELVIGLIEGPTFTSQFGCDFFGQKIRSSDLIDGLLKRRLVNIENTYPNVSEDAARAITEIKDILTKKYENVLSTLHPVRGNYPRSYESKVRLVMGDGFAILPNGESIRIRTRNVAHIKVSILRVLKAEVRSSRFR
jgi:hypothetical protein